MKINKTNLMLVLILILAFILRIIAAYHTHVSTDEMIYSIIPYNIIGSGQLGTVEQSPLYFYLTDLGYKISNGITAISVRLTSIIFGSLACLVIFLISKEIWNNKVGLYGAFLFAISGYGIKFNYEMDMLAFFFSLLSVFFFIKFIRNDNNSELYFATIFIVLGILAKIIVVLFIPAFIITWLLIKKKHGKLKKKISNQKLLKGLLISLIIGIFVFSPVLIYNYFTLKEKGTTDYFFSNVLGIGDTVHKGLQNKPWEFTRMIDIMKDKLKTMFKIDGVILIFGILGMIYAFKKNSYETTLFILTIFFLNIYIAGQTGSASHYLWNPIVLSIFAGYSLWNISKQIKFKHLVSIIILLAIISNIFLMQKIIDERETSITLKLRDYVKNKISEESIVVIDPRIYNGIHAWVFNDKHYLGGQDFLNLVNQLENIPNNKIEVPLFYVECGKGSNCGWKPEDFARIFDTGEKISSFFRDNTKKVAEINAGHNFNIYQGSMKIVPEVYEAIDLNHVFWFYPTGWKYPELAVDYYEVEGFNKLINWLGFLILWVDILLALLSIPLVFYISFKNKYFSTP